MTILLHGFWSQPADWNEVIRRLPLHAQVVAPDLYEPGPLAPHHELGDWTAHFLEWVREQSRRERVDLVGYSMGARLALNALIRAPGLFRRALLVSGLVLMPEPDKNARLTWEMDWREKFLKSSWEELETAWAEQPVFRADQKPVPRRRSEKLREMLGQSMVNWSPRLHPFSEVDVKALPASVEWAFGASDQKYLGVAKSLQEMPVRGQIHIIENAGHRIPMDAPKFISHWIEKG